MPVLMYRAIFLSRRRKKKAPEIKGIYSTNDALTLVLNES